MIVDLDLKLTIQKLVRVVVSLYSVGMMKNTEYLDLGMA